MIYSKMKIITKKDGKIKEFKDQTKEFNNLQKYMIYKRNIKLYIETRKNLYDKNDGIKILLNIWIKDNETKDVWQITSIINEEQEIILSEEEQKYLKDKIWNKKRGWIKEILQKEFDFHE